MRLYYKIAISVYLARNAFLDIWGYPGWVYPGTEKREDDST